MATTSELNPDDADRAWVAAFAHLAERAVVGSYRSRSAVVAAEVARMENRDLDAEQLYESALRLAREDGVPNDEGTVCQLAARFYDERGLRTAARTHIRAARAAFQRAGAFTADSEIDRSLTPVVPRDIAPADAAAVLAASQAISSEIVLERLLETFLRAALEQAGARRGVVLAPRNDELRIEAEAASSIDDGVVKVFLIPLTAEHLPMSIVGHVARSGEAVVLSDTLSSNPFASDAYLSKIPARSILCLPLMKRATLLGVLYLEHESTHAFIPSRIAAVTVLAAQAAISLENTRLYEDIEADRDWLRRIIDTIPELAWSMSPDGLIEFINRRWVDYTGIAADEARGSCWWRAIHPDDVDGLRRAWQRMIRNSVPEAAEARLQGADGRHRWFLFRVEPLHDGEGKVVAWYGASTDVDERKRAEEELEVSLRFWRLRGGISADLASARADELDARIDATLPLLGEFFDVESISIFWFSASSEAQATHLWAKPGIETPPGVITLEAFTHTESELRRGQEVRIARLDDLPEDRRSEVEALRAMGVRSIVALPLIIDGATLGLMSLAHRSREVSWSDEVVERMRLLSEPFANTLARQRAVLDLERSSIALSQAQRELAHITRVTLLGELTASIAHEINQPLAAIVAEASASLNWLEAGVKDETPLRYSLLNIAEDCHRASQILTRIRALVSPQATTPGHCDLNAVVTGVLPLVRSELLKDAIRMETELAANLPRVFGDLAELQQVLLNLVLNAADASRAVGRERRRIVVRSSLENESGTRAIVIAVEDAGTGLTSTDQEKLFRAFHTTKQDGVGMGLSICRAIIERHGGRLWAEPNERSGTTFRFALQAV